MHIWKSEKLRPLMLSIYSSWICMMQMRRDGKDYKTFNKLKWKSSWSTESMGIVVVVVVQSLSCVWFFATPRTTACQVSLSFSVSWSLLKLMSIYLVTPSNHLILYHPLLLLFSTCPRIRSFPMSQFFASGGQSIGVSASASVLPVNIQCWFPFELTDLISLLSRELSKVFSNATVQKHQFFGT